MRVFLRVKVHIDSELEKAAFLNLNCLLLLCDGLRRGGVGGGAESNCQLHVPYLLASISHRLTDGY